MVQTPDVKADSAGAGFGADYVDGLRGKRGSSSDVDGLNSDWSEFLSHGDGKGDFWEDVKLTSSPPPKYGKII